MDSLYPQIPPLIFCFLLRAASDDGLVDPEADHDLFTKSAEDLDETSAVSLETRDTITTSDSTLDLTMMILHAQRDYPICLLREA